MSDGLLNLTAQCCDADSYVRIGYQCAADNICFDYIRPIGITYWFSLPFRLNAPLDLLVWIQAALSIAIAFTLLYLFIFHYRKALPRQPRTASIIAVLCWTLALLAMAVWLYPTFFHTLSDTPSSLLVIQALLLIVVAAHHNSTICYLIAALLLGLSPLLRTAYFNPLLASLAGISVLWLALFIFTREKRLFWKRNGRSLLLLFSVFPLSLQYFNVWKNTGDISFNTSVYNQAAYSLHLDNMGAGYDTYLPQNGVYWSPSCSENVAGLITDWKAKNYSSMQCLLENRFRFYFGSYASQTYLGPYDRNYLDNGFAENVGTPGGWSGHSLDVALDHERSPLGDYTASQFTPRIVPENGPGYYMQAESELPLSPGKYRLMAWVWSSTPRPLTVRILSVQMEAGLPAVTTVVAEQDVSLSQTPKEIVLEADNSVLGFLRVQMGWFGTNEEIERAPKGTFSIWGVKLTPFDWTLPYTRPTGKMGAIGNMNEAYQLPERFFSDTLLLTNTWIILFGTLLLIGASYTFRSLSLLFCPAFLFLVLVQCLLVVPEQRFVQTLLAAQWAFFLLFLSLPLKMFSEYFHKKFSRQREGH